VAARRAVIVDVVRSPFGKGRGGGALHGMHPVDLYAQVLRALVARTGIDPAAVDDVITGCGIPVGETSGNIGRRQLLAAGLPCKRSGVNIDQKVRLGTEGHRLWRARHHRRRLRYGHRRRRRNDEPRAMRANRLGKEIWAP